MSILRYIIVALVIIAVIEDIFLVLVFYDLRRLLSMIAWKLIAIGFILALVNNILLGSTIIIRPPRLISLSLILGFFFTNATKQAIWLIGFLKFKKDIEFKR